MSRSASVLVLALAVACSDVGGPGGGSLATDELLLLGVQAGAPPVASQSFYVSNARAAVRRLQHSDAFGTLFLELEFPSGAIARLDGVPVGPDDSVLVTLTPMAGRYGVTVAPPGLEFVRTSRPAATFSFARYGDLSVADGSPTYGTRTAYAAALDLWRETSSELWQVAAASAIGPGDEVVGALDGGGRYVVAAPR